MAPAGSVVTLWADEASTSEGWHSTEHSVEADANGLFSFTGTEPLAEGEVSLRVHTDDGLVSDPITVTVQPSE